MSNWKNNRSDFDPDAALEQCQRIIDKLDGLSGATQERGATFFESVRGSVEGVTQTITQQRRCSAAQRKALRGWEKGVDRWVENDDDNDGDSGEDDDE
jgi:hypothetical protein